MGGQACVLYGAAECSRVTALVILADAANLARLRLALVELRADVVAVPPLQVRHLRRGHAVHFRCLHPDLLRMRVDVMSRLRGVGPFIALWRRRSTVTLPDGFSIDVLSLPDLVRAKKTQRDKDWPMLRRLVEAHYFQYRDHPPPRRHGSGCTNFVPPNCSWKWHAFTGALANAPFNDALCYNMRFWATRWRERRRCARRRSVNEKPTAATGNRCGASWRGFDDEWETHEFA